MACASRISVPTSSSGHADLALLKRSGVVNVFSKEGGDPAFVLWGRKIMQVYVRRAFHSPQLLGGYWLGLRIDPIRRGYWV